MSKKRKMKATRSALQNKICHSSYTSIMIVYLLPNVAAAVTCGILGKVVVSLGAAVGAVKK